MFDLESFIDLSPDLVCVAGYDGYFKKINSAVSTTLGYTREELMARPICDFIHADDRLITGKKRENILKGRPLLNFENRYVTKSGEVVWLTWTSIPIKAENVVFAIAKNITHKKIEAYRRLSQLNDTIPVQQATPANKLDKLLHGNSKSKPGVTAADRTLLVKLETLVRKYTGKIDINISSLSNDMAISERQLYRRIKNISGITPNQYIRNIRLQLACEAIETGKYRTISEISYIAGFRTPTYFRELFEETYGIDICEFL